MCDKISEMFGRSLIACSFICVESVLVSAARASNAHFERRYSFRVIRTYTFGA